MRRWVRVMPLVACVTLAGWHGAGAQQAPALAPPPSANELAVLRAENERLRRMVVDLQRQAPTQATPASGPEPVRQAPGLAPPPPSIPAAAAQETAALRAENDRLRRAVDLLQQKVALLEQRIRTLEAAR